ncbi:hypothetical protein ILUMI_16397 [Ignelater luminosus]|uniref:Uncharacterized protein n=1 Tax=Ignelater luminosus TaxID=2038154 RepID=A0A8K0CQE8_IGNLU|nr:hypothetical protein ILUMI_16397 [Ignelater luminosus]
MRTLVKVVRLLSSLYPKAPARKKTQKGKKPGSSKIATYTPEKDQIREQKKTSKPKSLNTEAMDLVSEDKDDGTDLLNIINQKFYENQEEMNFARATFGEMEYVLVTIII